MKEGRKTPRKSWNEQRTEKGRRRRIPNVLNGTSRLDIRLFRNPDKES